MQPQAFFSTTFFSFGENGGDWKFSKRLWIYWLFAIPATALVAVTWLLWLRGIVQKFWARFVEKIRRAKPEKPKEDSPA